MKETELLKNLVLNEFTNCIQEFIATKDSISLEQLKIKIEYSRNEKFGDYSSAFLLENKEILGNPIENSKILLELLQKNNNLFQEISFTNPGFFNFRVHRNFLANYLARFILDEQNRNPHLDVTEKIIFEFVSANPTGPLNIVSARAAATGDSICNLLQRVGHTVHREFYVNDYGNQVELLGISCLMRLRESLGEELKFQEENDNTELARLLESNTLPYEAYRGEYIKDIVQTVYPVPGKKEKIDKFLQIKDYSSLISFFTLEALNYNLNQQKKDLENFGVSFDLFYSERSLHEKGKVLDVLQFLKKSGDIQDENGKKIFLSTRYNDDKDRVVVREDGRPTYLLADIAYHKDKMDRGFDRMINIWGPDHHGYIARLQGAIQSMGYSRESFRVIIAQQVNLLHGGEKMKMSKRLGLFKTMDELMSYLGEKSNDLARYFFSMRALETPLDFDLDLAKEESDKNPVFYAQYAHARIASIFREIDVEPDLKSFISLESTEERDRLLFWVARWNEEVLDAAKNFEPHRLATYLQNLCKAFSRFYIAKGNKLKDCNVETQKGLAFLCQSTQICIRESLAILGVGSPERMEKQDK